MRYSERYAIIHNQLVKEATRGGRIPHSELMAMAGLWPHSKENSKAYHEILDAIFVKECAEGLGPLPLVAVYKEGTRLTPSHAVFESCVDGWRQPHIASHQQVNNDQTYGQWYREVREDLLDAYLHDDADEEYEAGLHRINRTTEG